jgi:hypothetical protein
MVKFNEKPPLEFIDPDLSAETSDTLKQVFDITTENIFAAAQDVHAIDNTDKQFALMLTSTAALNASIRSAFLAMGATPQEAKQDLIADCMKLVLTRLHDEL